MSSLTGSRKRLFYSNNLRAGPISRVPPGAQVDVISETGQTITTEDNKTVIEEQNS